MKEAPESMVRALVEACRDAGQRGLMRCSSGNMSLRVDAEHMLITTSRSWLERLTAEDVTLCRIADGVPLDGRRASVETGFHAGILRTRPDVNVVLHFQTPFATTLACRPMERVNFFVIPEIPVYIGPIGLVPYISPGSPELAKAVVAAMRDHDLAMLANHGQVTVAADFDHALQNASFFELACEIIVRGGEALIPLPADAAAEFVAARRQGRARSA